MSAAAWKDEPPPGFFDDDALPAAMSKGDVFGRPDRTPMTGANGDRPGDADSPEPPPLASRLVVVEPSWLSEPPAPRLYLARDTRTNRGALEATGAYLLAAAGGVGKSYATIGLAVAVASGTAWLGCMAVERAGRVLMISAEESADEVRRRLYHVARSVGVKAIPDRAIDVLDIHDRHTPLLDAHGYVTLNAEEIVELARTRGPYSLVVADPIARLAGAPIDKDNVAAGALVSVLEAISTAASGLVLGVLHTSLQARREKDIGATAIRGATGLGDSARMVMVLSADALKHGDPNLDSRLGELVTLVLAKKNHVRHWEPIELRRGEHGELVPLDVADRELVAAARCRTAPAAARRDAREADRAARKEKDAAERDARAAQHLEEEAERFAAEDKAASAILVEHGPTMTCRAWYAEMRARLGSCSKERADAARARARR